MGNIAIFRINYKSDFVLTLNSDAGWMTPFCIKFWTGAPSQAYFVGWDGTTYTNCAPVAGEPTKLQVQFDDHHLPVGELKYQIGYHFTVADFPNDTEDEVLNQERVIIEIDGHNEKVMLDFKGETAPDIQFSLPAYANEAQRIANEEQRIENEQQRIDNEQQRIDNEQTRQRNEGTRIENEQQRVQEFGQMKGELEQATRDAAAAAENANEKGVYAKNQGDYAKQQGDYAKQQGDIAQADHERAEEDHRIAGEDHTQAGSDHTRAGEDHTQAGSDHTRAGEDHTRAGDDHTRAESDHTRAESDHAVVELYVDSLGAFDISAYHATGGVLATYANLQAALGTKGANIPEALRKGGMSVKFVQENAQSSDNKYVRYNLLADSFTTDVTQWAIDDNGVYVENPEFLAVWIDRNKKIILGVRKDADIYFGAGVPQQIIDYIQEKLGSFSSDVYEDIVTFLGNLIDGDNTLLELFNEKVDKEDGKALIDENVAERVHYVENPEYIEVELDADKKILKATKTNGTKVFYTDVELLGNLSSPVLSELAKEQQKNSVEIEENKKDHFDKSIGFVSTQNSVKSYEEWMSLTGNSILTDEYETLNSISRKPKKKFRRMLAINHDDLPIVDYISQRKLLNKYGFTSSFSYIMRLFSSVEEKETAQENVSKMIKDGQRILLHALFDETSPFADPLYEVKPDKKTNFAPSLAELQPIGSTGKNSLGYSVDSNTKFGSLGFVYPAVDVKVVDATEEQYFTIYSRYCVWNLLANRTGLDFENNLVTKNTLEWFEYIYNSLIDNTLGYSTYNGTVAERYAADYRVPSGGSAIEYYPDLSHIKSGNIIRYSSIGSTTRYEWYAWKHENNIVYTLSNSPQIGDIVYSDTALTQLSTVASIDSNTITDSLSNSYDRFDHLDVVNHLDSSGNQSVGVFTKGLFKGCATCMNIEVLDRIIMIARSYFKHHFGSDVFDGYTAHGGWRSNCVWSYNNYKYYDREKRYLCYEGTKVLNTRLGCYRSIFDVFENNGFKVIVNTPYHSVITPKEGFVYLYEGECEIRPTHLYCWGTPQLPSIAYPNIFNDPNGEIRIGGLTEVLDVFYNISNWEKYILEHTGETVTGRSGDTYVISNWLRRCLMRIVSCFNTGKVPQLSFDTIRNSSLMKLAVEMLYKFCYNNDIDIVSFDEARKVTINTPKPFMTNYFPNPSFQQTIKDFYGVNNTWINIPDGFSEIAGVYTDTSVITVENEQVLETSYNVLKLTAGGISTRIYGLQPGTYKFSCYAKQTANRDGRIKIAKRKNGDEYAIDDTRNMDNISVGNTWALIEKQFVIEQPVVIHDTSNNDIFCDGHQNNTSNVQIVFLSSSNEELDIANPQIVLI